MTLRAVSIRYLRPPDRLQTFEQFVLEAGERVVTFVESTPLPSPVRVGGRIVLEPGAPVIWLTYPGAWHDIGLFHRADGTFTGIYANILTPVRMEGDRWETTDLFLDLWVAADGSVTILDEDEFAAAIERGWLGPATAASARAEADRLVALARAGAWPPADVARWDLARARRRLHELREAADDAARR